MAATIKDIAEMTGLSVATISKYLNGGNVREKNRPIIQQAIEKTNYRLNEHARALKTNSSRTIGFMVPRFADVFSAELASAASMHLREYQYSLFVYESQGTLAGEVEALDFFRSKNVDAVIATLSGLDRDYYEELFSKYRFPIVLFDRAFEKPFCDSVTIDNQEAGYIAARQLIEHGHRDIAIIRGTTGNYTSDQRYLGYLRALEEAGIPLNPAFVLEVGYGSIHVYDNIRKLFAHDCKPTALFTVNYFTTVSTLMILNQLDISIPKDVSVFGFDNYDLINIVKPRLSLMIQPILSIAQEGTKLLLERIKKENASSYQNVVLKAEMSMGDSIRRMAE